MARADFVGACQGPAFGTSASYHEGRHVVATAQGPTFATEEDVVDIVLLAGDTPAPAEHSKDLCCQGDTLVVLLKCLLFTCCCSCCSRALLVLGLLLSGMGFFRFGRWTGRGVAQHGCAHADSERHGQQRLPLLLIRRQRGAPALSFPTPISSSLPHLPE